ncbi:uncharacterized protein LOC133819029 isoform X2 [Humulus lupulus]|uniref:uncharacterized protein LOC133819029 isoform X2 n=1 Tax=Humulus lupulus TaxID=3486 RepID=UPI002B401EC3|nr:uncharacterized protein LOC133819029 isoform X2 [Humulus lupulus]
MAVRELPFKVGHLAESRSFCGGFRGAWFRCKIKGTLKEKSQKKFVLEYFDFPGEDAESILLYQRRPTKTGKLQQKKEIMLRPPFPTVYRESQMPNVNNISEVSVVFKDVRKVGDLVDWFTDSCYWSGRIELLRPPLGEGSFYNVLCKDLRPSLDWSPKSGWTVPTSMDSKHGPSCARILKPVDQGRSSTLLAHSASADTTVVSGVGEASQSSFVSHASSNSSQPSDKLEDKEKNREKEMHTSVTDINSDMANNSGIGKTGCSDNDSISHAKSTPNKICGTPVSQIMILPPDQLEGNKKRPLSTTVVKNMHVPGKDMKSDMTADSGFGRTNFSDNDSNSHVKSASNEIGGTTGGKDRFDDGGSLKKMRTDGNILPNLLFSNSMEAAIVNLEDLVNRVKWMKSILQTDMPSSEFLEHPSWKFLEHHASSTPK